MSFSNAYKRHYYSQASLNAALRLVFTRLFASDFPVFTVQDLAHITSGGTPDRTNSAYYGGNIAWLKSGELEDTTITSTEEYITEEGLNNSSAKIFPSGTLVVALYGATVGKTGILKIDAASNQAVCSIIPKTTNPTVSTQFLYWFFRYKRPDYLQTSFGGAQPNISQKIIRETKIPLPNIEIQNLVCEFLSLLEAKQPLPNLPSPLDDVKNIVARVEELAAKIAEAQALRQQALEANELLKLQIYSKVYSETALLYGTVALKEICTTITDGTHSTPHYVDEGIPFLSVKDITSGVISFANVRYITVEEHIELTKRCKPEKDDILLTKVGTTGFTKIIDVDREFSIFVSLALLKLNKTLVQPKYLDYMLNSTIVQSQVKDNTRGVGNKNLVLKFIKEFPIPLPPLEEQERIVKYLDGLQAKIEAVKQLQAATQAELDALLPAVLDKAFKGELLATG